MTIKILIEIALATIIFFLGYTFWQSVKRDNFLKLALHNPQFLADIITKQILEVYLETRTIWFQKYGDSYLFNIHALLKSDQKTQRMLKACFGALIIIALIGSAYLGLIFLIINITLCFMSRMLPLDPSARRTAIDHLITLAAILYKWIQEDKIEAEQLIKQSPGFQIIYETIQKLN